MEFITNTVTAPTIVGSIDFNVAPHKPAWQLDKIAAETLPLINPSPNPEIASKPIFLNSSGSISPFLIRT